MGAAEDMELVRRGYAAFNSGDVATLAELFDERASWHTPGRSPVAGDYAGREAVFGQLRRYAGETQGTFHAELRHVVADGLGHVVGVHHNTGTRNGKQLDVDCCVVFELLDGRAVRGREFFFDLGAWDAFWS